MERGLRCHLAEIINYAREIIFSVITHLFLKIKFKTKSPIIDDTRDTSLATRQYKPCCNKNKFSLLLMLNPYESLLPYHFFFQIKISFVTAKESNS